MKEMEAKANTNQFDECITCCDRPAKAILRCGCAFCSVCLNHFVKSKPPKKCLNSISCSSTLSLAVIELKMPKENPFLKPIEADYGEVEVAPVVKRKRKRGK
jgi:hypothetical protein